MQPIDESTTLYTSDDEDYVSTTMSHYTPFPSLTEIQKQQIDEFCHNYTHEIVIQSDENQIEGNPVNDESAKQPEDEQVELKKHGCCLLI